MPISTFALQRVMQIQPRALENFLKLRREYVMNVAGVCKRRQQLLHQLQSAPQLLGNDSREIGSRLSVTEEITEQLQQCVTEEDELLFEFSGTVSLTVSRHEASPSLTGITHCIACMLHCSSHLLATCSR